jgi:hypothetical protein
VVSFLLRRNRQIIRQFFRVQKLATGILANRAKNLRQYAQPLFPDQFHSARVMLALAGVEKK